MNPVMWTMSILAGVALTSLVVCLLTLYRVHLWARRDAVAAPPQSASVPVHDPEVRELRTAVEALAARLVDVSSQAQVAGAPASAGGVPKSGFNLNKRSQVLRLHRRGEGTEQIAGALEIPRGEVDLLLKVHRIVMDNV
jgi:hypothetical protein